MHKMYQAAIAQLAVSAETCENNAPIYEAEGKLEQAALAQQSAEDCRAAIEHLSDNRAYALECALRTQGTQDHHDVLRAAHAYECYLQGN